ncbi:MAG: threonine-phosphate decarboxylase CobD [Roseinatronobacter sp.]
MRDHGGDLDRARAQFGGSDWIDLSTGINRTPWPLPAFPPEVWTSLPTRADTDALEARAACSYRAPRALALAGAQAAIQLVPRLSSPGRAAVLSPSYNEHAAALQMQGWRVDPAPDLAAMEGADLAVVVNPNNPDGRVWPPEALAALADRVGRLVVDESFIDATPDLSLAPGLGDAEKVVILRSFGKFYGLAGLRLGFALAGPETHARLRALAGPWAVSGPAVLTGQQALADDDWRAAMAGRLQADAVRLDALVAGAGWTLLGGCALFRTYVTLDATAAQTRLARARIWSRRFPYSATWLRLGLPGPAPEWDRLRAALVP